MKCRMARVVFGKIVPCEGNVVEKSQKVYVRAFDLDVCDQRHADPLIQYEGMIKYQQCDTCNTVSAVLSPKP